MDETKNMVHSNTHPKSNLEDPWIRGKFFDSIFFIPVLPLALFLPAFYLFNNVLGYTVLWFWLYSLLLRLPHFVATLDLTWLHKPTRDRMDIFRFYVVPFALILAYLIPTFLRLPADGLYVIGITGIAHFLGIQHIALQNYGFLRIYRRNEGADQIKWEVKLEKYIFVSLATLNFLLYIQSVKTTHRDLLPYISHLGSALYVVLAIFIGIYTFLRFYGKRSSLVSFSPGNIHFILSFLVMYPWDFWRNSFFTSFFVYNFHHGLAYLGLVWAIKQERGTNAQSRPKGLFFYIGLVLMAAVVLGISKMPGVNTGRFFAETIYGFFMVHYYVESLIWKPVGGITAHYFKIIKKSEKQGLVAHEKKQFSS